MPETTTTYTQALAVADEATREHFENDPTGIEYIHRSIVDALNDAGLLR